MSEDPKEILRKKEGIIAVDLVEVSGEMPRPVLTILMNGSIPNLAPSIRTPLATNLIAWMTLYRDAIENPEDSVLTIHRKNDTFPPPEEMLEHLERSLQSIREHWPFEVQHAESCVFDKMTATHVLSQFPIPGGLNQVKTLLPEGSVGVISRCPSPVNFFRHPDPAPSERSMSGIGRLVILRPGAPEDGPDDEDQTSDVKFPED